MHVCNIFSAVPLVGGDEPLAGQQPGAPGPQARQHHEVHQGNKSVSQSWTENYIKDLSEF